MNKTLASSRGVKMETFYRKTVRKTSTETSQNVRKTCRVSVSGQRLCYQTTLTDGGWWGGAGGEEMIFGITLGVSNGHKNFEVLAKFGFCSICSQNFCNCLHALASLAGVFRLTSQTTPAGEATHARTLLKICSVAQLQVP